MEHIFELLLKNGLRPLSLLPNIDEIELKVSRSEVAVLLLLSFRGTIPMSELSDVLGAPLSTMTSITKRLVSKGFIERRKAPQDQRIILVQLTRKGKDLVTEIRKQVDRVLIHVQAAFTEEELNQLLSLVMKLVRVLQSEQIESTHHQESESKLRTIKIGD